MRALVREVLSGKGYAVLEARHGGDALLINDQHNGRIDLLLADVVLPHMSGPAVAEHLLRKRVNLKVLFVSGYTDSPILRDSLMVKEAPFLQKPFTPDSVARKVRDVLDGKIDINHPGAKVGPGVPSAKLGKGFSG